MTIEDDARAFIRHRVSSHAERALKAAEAYLPNRGEHLTKESLKYLKLARDKLAEAIGYLRAI